MKKYGKNSGYLAKYSETVATLLFQQIWFVHAKLPHV